MQLRLRGLVRQIAILFFRLLSEPGRGIQHIQHEEQARRNEEQARRS